jgi:predicted RNA binding protein YcfA (HicA-like mRNA interferase family)
LPEEDVPPKIRDLIAMLEQAGYERHSGKGSHRKFVHPTSKVKIVLSGPAGADAKHYQVRAVAQALEDAKS